MDQPNEVTPTELQRTTIYLPKEFHIYLRSLGLNLGIPMSNLMVELIQAGLKTNYPDEIPPINPEEDN